MRIVQLGIIALLLSLLPQKSNAQKIDTITRKDANGWEFFQIRHDGVPYQEGYKKNGIPQGNWVLYYGNGMPATVLSYADGKKDGLLVQYNPSGLLEMIEHYKADKLEGPRRLYKNGYMYEETYYSNGMKHGTSKKWYAPNQMQESGAFTNDIRDGKTTWYYQNGNKAVEYTYRNGKIEGEAATYHDNGKVNEVGVYDNNLQKGEWKEFYINGNLKAKGDYKEGKKDGVWQLYDEAGKPLEKKKYKNGNEV